MKVTEQSKKRMSIAGEQERYSIAKFFNQLNEDSIKHSFKVIMSDSNRSIGYDAMVLVKDKLTGESIKWIMLEAKVRSTEFDNWFLELKKLNTLKRDRKYKIEKEYINLPIQIMYINFTPNKTLLWNLSKLEKDKSLGELVRREMNEVTVQSTTKKTKKQVYLLEEDMGIVFDFKYNAENHIEELKEEIVIKEKQITGLGTWLFNKKTNDRIKEYKK